MNMASAMTIAKTTCPKQVEKKTCWILKDKADSIGFLRT